MNQFLAQPALINRVLVLERRGAGFLEQRGLDGGRRALLMDMGLDRQALEEKSQQGEYRHPLAGGGGSYGGMSRTHHWRVVPRLRIMRSPGLPQSKPLFSL